MKFMPNYNEPKSKEDIEANIKYCNQQQKRLTSLAYDYPDQEEEITKQSIDIEQKRLGLEMVRAKILETEKKRD